MLQVSPRAYVGSVANTSCYIYKAQLYTISFPSRSTVSRQMIITAEVFRVVAPLSTQHFGSCNYCVLTVLDWQLHLVHLLRRDLSVFCMECWYLLSCGTKAGGAGVTSKRVSLEAITCPLLSKNRCPTLSYHTPSNHTCCLSMHRNVLKTWLH